MMLIPLYETVNKNKFLFSGTSIDHDKPQMLCSKSGSGENCGALIQQEDRGIKYDQQYLTFAINNINCIILL